MYQSSTLFYYSMQVFITLKRITLTRDYCFNNFASSSSMLWGSCRLIEMFEWNTECIILLSGLNYAPSISRYLSVWIKELVVTGLVTVMLCVSSERDDQLIVRSWSLISLLLTELLFLLSCHVSPVDNLVRYFRIVIYS